MRRVLILMACTMALALPRPADADVLLTPFAGVSFLDGDIDKAAYGVSLGFGGLIGIEGELARTSLADVSIASTPIGLEAHITTAMANLVIRLPAGPVQPYASGGLGVVRVSGDLTVPFLGSVFGVSGQDLGMNVGGGVLIYPSRHIGLRGDVRYFRTIGDLTLDELRDIGGLDDLPLPEFDFWRVTGGVVIRF